MELSLTSTVLLGGALIMLLIGAVIAGITADAYKARKSLLGPMVMASSLLISGVGLLAGNELTLLAIAGALALTLVGGILAICFGFAYANKEY